MIVTREPVTAPTLPPGTQATPPLEAMAFVDSPSQLPGEPEALVSKTKFGLGKPTPVYPELVVKRHPAEQKVVVPWVVKQAKGQSPGIA